MNLVFGDDQRIADWASKVSGSPLRNWNYAVGIIDRTGLLVGAISLHDMNGSNVEFCWYGKHSASLSVVRGMLNFCFNKLKVNRVMAKTPRQNKMVLKHLPRYGFRFEGVMKRYYGPTKRLDGIVFGLLRPDAERFLRGS
jgi:RimJ/RimL family protein N-acetyltransferase